MVFTGCLYFGLKSMEFFILSKDALFVEKSTTTPNLELFICAIFMPSFIQTIKHNVSNNKVKTNVKYIKGRSLGDVIY